MQIKIINVDFMECQLIPHVMLEESIESGISARFSIKNSVFPLFPFKISFLGFTQPGNQHSITPLRNIQAHSSKADSDQYANPP